MAPNVRVVEKTSVSSPALQRCLQRSCTHDRSVSVCWGSVGCRCQVQHIQTFWRCCAGKNENEEKRELIFREDGQGMRHRTECCSHTLNIDCCITDVVACRVCSSSQNAGPGPIGGAVYGRSEEIVSHSGQNEKESLGQRRGHRPSWSTRVPGAQCRQTARHGRSNMLICIGRN